uniref:Uncharacterized protein n=1 Tax=viral metagenome TaxID=1070528 RepID=A0A6C0FIW9_9ZZZZ|tara:strand:- start:1141 stop:2514 length:1374 start_codon:yes stop_codon:yes gene_type:complete
MSAYIGSEEYIDFVEKVNKYYELKSKYENFISQKKQHIKKTAKVSGLSKKDTRDMFRKFTPDCVSCNRKVGCVFEKKKKDGAFHLLATCGSKLEPCKLNIDINTGNIMHVLVEKRKEEEDMDKYINEIIITKNEELFGFITEEDAVKKFEYLNNELNSSAGYYNEILQSYISVVHNKTRQDELKSLSQLLNTQVISIKNNINEYVKTNRKQYVKDAIELYVTDMAETIHKINNTKYKDMRVEYSPVTKEYTLIQKRFNEQDFALHGDYEVLKYEIGKPDINKKKSTDAQSALADNIVDMSARDVGNESDVEEEVETSNKINKVSQNIGATSDSEPYVPAPTPPSSEKEIDDEDEDENNIADDISDVSSDASSVEYKPPLVIGENIDSSSDSFIPPPPPMEDESSESVQYQIGTPDVTPNTPPLSPSTPPVPPPENINQTASLPDAKSDESEKYSPLS